MDLYQEYEDNKTPEGRLVKDLDKLEMIIQAFEYEQDHGFDLNKRDLSDFYLSAKKIRHPIAVGIAREVAHRRAVALASVSANE